jgi:hypothetical protein
MSGPEGEFEEFLARRRPVFPRPPEDVLEPPAELDRLVLRQAREAIRPESPEPAYHGARWGMPVAIAASVLVAATLVLHVGLKREPVPQVTVQTITQRVDETAAAPAPAAAPQTAPAWRRDARSWTAHIDRLRAEGRTAEADAEMLEFRKAHRAYAAGPDR